MNNRASRKKSFRREQKYIIEKVSELREELEDLIDYLSLLEARVLNFGKLRHTSDYVRKVLKIK
jgi:uncharacterized coiled-coil DUF342 family protein